MNWYLTKIHYPKIHRGKYKYIPEVYLLHCFSHTDVEATLTELLKNRFTTYSDPDISKPKPKEVFKINHEMPINEPEGNFYLVIVECDLGKKKVLEKYYLNATSTVEADTKVREWLKSVTYDFEIKETKETKIVGIYDKNNSLWVTDWEKRMDDLIAKGATDTKTPTEKVPKTQMDIPFETDPNKLASRTTEEQFDQIGDDVNKFK